MPKVSQEHKDGRRRQILLAASRCFASVGFHVATMQDVIKASGLSAGAIYNHFASKEEIIAAIANERHAREAALFRAAEAEPDPYDAIQHLAWAFFEHLSDERQEERRVGVQLWAETLSNKKLLRMAKDGTAEPYRVLCRLIDRMKAAGALSTDVDSGALARVMIALFQGLVLQKCRDKDLDLQAYVHVVMFLWERLQTNSRPPKSRGLGLAPGNEDGLLGIGRGTVRAKRRAR